MKLSVAIGILSSQTFVLPVVSETEVLSNTKLDSIDPLSPVLRGGSSSQVHVVGSTTTTPLTNKTRNKKAVECIPPPQGEVADADYDLGVLACATSTSTTLAGQICVPSDDSTLGGYCMDPPRPPPMDAAESRRLLNRFSDEGLFRQVCQDRIVSAEELLLLSPIDFCFCFTGSAQCRSDSEPYSSTCGLQTSAYYYYKYEPDGALYKKTNCIELNNDISSADFFSARVCYTIYPQGQCTYADRGEKCESCFGSNGSVCPTVFDDVRCFRRKGCSFTCLDDGDQGLDFGCITPRSSPAGTCIATYSGSNVSGDCICTTTDGGVQIDCSALADGFIVSTSEENPWKTVPVVRDCKPPTQAPTLRPTRRPRPTRKPTRAPTLRPTRAPKPTKKPTRAPRPRQLVSSRKTPDVDSAERLLIDPMNNLEEAFTAATKDDANAEKDSSTLEG